MNGDDIELPAPLPAEVRRRVNKIRKYTKIFNSPRIAQIDKDRLHQCFLKAIAEFTAHPPTADDRRRVQENLIAILRSIVPLPLEGGRGE